MNKITSFRFCVFWIWAATIAVILTVFVSTLIRNSMTFKEIDESLSQIMGLIVPQISVMTAFFFGSTKDDQQRLIAKQQGLATFAVGLSLVYHVSFWVLVVLGIGLGIFGHTIDENGAAVTRVLGFLSAFGLSPVAYLFASGGSSRRAAPSA